MSERKFSSRSRNERSEVERTKERLTETLGELVAFQTVADGRHNEHMRGIFDYVQVAVANAATGATREFVVQEWDNDGHISTIVTPRDPKRPDNEAILNPKIGMLIHADVVGAGDKSMFHMRKEGDDLVGRGALDMKAGMAIGLDLLPELPVGTALIITSDEEVGGEHGAQFLADTVGVKPDFLVILDGQKPEHVSFGAKGVWHGKITVGSLLQSGGHGSRYEDFSAIELGMDFRNKMRQKYPWEYGNSPSGTTFNIGEMSGGVAMNSVAEQAVFQVDARFPNEEARAQVKIDVYSGLQSVVENQLHEIYGDDLPVSLVTKLGEKNEHNILELILKNNETGEGHTVVSVDTKQKIPTYTIDPSDARVRKFIEIHEEISGEQIKRNDKDTGSHDGAKWPDVPAVIFLPKGSNAHGNGERVSATSLVQTREVLAQFMKVSLSE